MGKVKLGFKKISASQTMTKGNDIPSYEFTLTCTWRNRGHKIMLWASALTWAN